MSEKLTDSEYRLALRLASNDRNWREWEKADRADASMLFKNLVSEVARLKYEDFHLLPP